LAEIHDNAVLGVGDDLHFNNFVLRVSFLLLIVLRHNLAHLFGAAASSAAATASASASAGAG